MRFLILIVEDINANPNKTLAKLEWVGGWVGGWVADDCVLNREQLQGAAGKRTTPSRLYFSLLFERLSLPSQHGCTEASSGRGRWEGEIASGLPDPWTKELYHPVSELHASSTEPSVF